MAARPGRCRRHRGRVSAATAAVVADSRAPREIRALKSAASRTHAVVFGTESGDSSGQTSRNITLCGHDSGGRVAAEPALVEAAARPRSSRCSTERRGARRSRSASRPELAQSPGRRRRRRARRRSCRRRRPDGLGQRVGQVDGVHERDRRRAAGRPCSRIPRTRLSGSAHERAISPPSSAWSMPSTAASASMRVAPRACVLVQLVEQRGIEEAGHHELADVVQQRRGRRLGRRAVGGPRRRAARRRARRPRSGARARLRSSPYCREGVVEAAAHVHAQGQGEHRARTQADHRVPHGRDLAAARAPRGVRRPQQRGGEGLVELHDLDDLAELGRARAHQRREARAARGQRLQLGGGLGQLVEVDHARADRHAPRAPLKRGLRGPSAQRRSESDEGGLAQVVRDHDPHARRPGTRRRTGPRRSSSRRPRTAPRPTAATGFPTASAVATIAPITTMYAATGPTSAGSVPPDARAGSAAAERPDRDRDHHAPRPGTATSAGPVGPEAGDVAEVRDEERRRARRRTARAAASAARRRRARTRARPRTTLGGRRPRPRDRARPPRRRARPASPACRRTRPAASAGDGIRRARDIQSPTANTAGDDERDDRPWVHDPTPCQTGRMAFHHVAITTKDLDATHRFYTEAWASSS